VPQEAGGIIHCQRQTAAVGIANVISFFLRAAISFRKKRGETLANPVASSLYDRRHFAEAGVGSDRQGFYGVIISRGEGIDCFSNATGISGIISPKRREFTTMSVNDPITNRGLIAGTLRYR